MSPNHFSFLDRAFFHDPTILTMPCPDLRFAVLIIPTYTNPKDSLSSPFATNPTLAVNQDPALREAYQAEQAEREHLRGEGERRNSWKWFHTVNRVCSGVKKVRVLFSLLHSRVIGC